jgi:hypothetical protein
MFKGYWIWLHENLRGVAIAAAIILVLVGAIAAMEASRLGPVKSIVAMIGTVEKIESINIEHKAQGVTYRYRVRFGENEWISLDDWLRRPIGSQVKLERIVRENGSVSVQIAY